MCYCRRPGSFRADAFRGHGFSLLEKNTLRGLQTRAVPAGVTALHSPGLVEYWDAFYRTVTTIVDGYNCNTSVGNHEDSCGNSEDDETPQRSLRGGPSRARGKRSVFQERRQHINSNNSLCRLFHQLQ